MLNARSAYIPQSSTASLHRPPAISAHTLASASALRVLVIDDDPPVREACVEIAAGLGFLTETADSFRSAQRALAGGIVDIILLDLKLPGGNGLLLLDEIRRHHPAAIIVVMTAFATVDSAVEAMRFGAGDYLAKPFSLAELSATLERVAHRRTFDTETRRLREHLRTGSGMGLLVGRSPAMEKLYRILSKVAFTTHPVLILGEPGTGKELVARSIHGNGPNAAGPFLTVDCSSLPPGQLERELFGHVEAGEVNAGLLAAASGGTVFLDEVAQLPLDLQTRLLRTLQEKELRPVGSTQPIPFSARLLASTHRDLQSLVDSGRFRKDLYYRLNVVKLSIPPLRERKSDIPLLAAHVLERLSRERNEAYTLAQDAMRLMMDYDWPGNVRELEHAIERACALSSGPVLHLGDFPTQLQDARLHLEHEAALAGIEAEASSARGLTTASAGSVLPIAEIEKQAILGTLRQLHGDKQMAARLLGIGKTTLYRKLKEYGVTDDDL